MKDIEFYQQKKNGLQICGSEKAKNIDEKKKIHETN